MRLGLDFDNTLVDYDPLIRAVAVERGLLDAASPLCDKRSIRDHLRRQPKGDLRWQEIQSYIYSEGIERAAPTTDLEQLFDFVRDEKPEVWIVSHKTATAPFDSACRNLRAAALRWMETHGFFDTARLGLSRARVIFADTKEQKIAAIRDLKLTAFVDDLVEILTDPNFPPATRRLLYSAKSRTATAVKLHGAWPEIVTLLRQELSVEKLAHALAASGCSDYALAPVRGGRNSRCFRASSVATLRPALFLKAYFSHARDQRDRLGTEYQALEFMHRHGIVSVPAPVFADRGANCACYSFTDGTPALSADISADDIDALLDFLRQLHGRRTLPDAARLPLASEAFFCLRDIRQNIEARFARLAAVDDPDLRVFLAAVSPLLCDLAAEAESGLADHGFAPDEPLPSALRTLSPSDIGFHNALRQSDGAIVFVDFEYFGWDDPAKLISDFLLQPEQRLTTLLCERFVEGALAIYDDPTLARRLRLYQPLFRLKWATILLNEFLREDGARRRFAAAPGSNRRAILDAQLAKARRMVEPLCLSPLASS